MAEPHPAPTLPGRRDARARFADGDVAETIEFSPASSARGEADEWWWWDSLEKDSDNPNPAAWARSHPAMGRPRQHHLFQPGPAAAAAVVPGPAAAAAVPIPAAAAAAPAAAVPIPAAAAAARQGGNLRQQTLARIAAWDGGIPALRLTDGELACLMHRDRREYLRRLTLARIAERRAGLA